MVGFVMEGYIYSTNIEASMEFTICDLLCYEKRDLCTVGPMVFLLFRMSSLKSPSITVGKLAVEEI